MTSRLNILLVDDELIERGSLSLLLEQEGYNVTAVENALTALAKLEEEQFDIVLTDILMSGMTGMDLLREIKKRNMGLEVILITAYGNIPNAVKAIKAGAFGYVQKNTPDTDEELNLTIKRAAERLRLIRENETLKTALNHRDRFSRLIGRSNQMQEIYDLIDTVADSKAGILIQGETGTGKDLVARAIHEKSSRARGPFVKTNCAGVPKELLESEMFGHVKGAFTSAIRDKIGRFEAAHTGTMFLDDIDTFPMELQAKLLRVLQEQEFERVGSTETIKVDVRIIAASNQDLQGLITEGLFRADLFYRLNVVPIQLPALKERPGDIIVLANHFLQKFNAENKKDISGFTDDALRMLEKYHWPGNVRQLENVVERAVILERNSYITPERLMLFQPQPVAASQSSATNSGSLKDEIKSTEKDVIFAALERNRWQRQKTAEELGINRVTLYNKMKKYGLADR